MLFEGAHTAFLFQFNGLKALFFFSLFHRIYFLSDRSQTNSNSPAACWNVIIKEVRFFSRPLIGRLRVSFSN